MTIQACADLVRRGDPDRFLATMAAPSSTRAVLFPLYAFNLEVARAPWVTEEPKIAEMRLQWWRVALDEIAQGKPVRAHEVTPPLAPLIDATGAGLLDRLIAARRWDIYRDPFEDAAHFENYLNMTAGNLTWVAARALGATTGEAALRDIAFASGLAAWFLAIPELEARGRVPLVDGRASAITALADQGLSRLHRSRKGPIPRAARPLILSAWRAGILLRQARTYPERVANADLRQSEFTRRGSLLWQSLLSS